MNGSALKGNHFWRIERNKVKKHA